MEQKKLYQLSYPDSVKILKESCKKQEAIRSLMQQAMDDDKERLLHAINKILYEAAEKQGESLYTLCFNTVPDIESDGFTTTIRLVPVVFDFTHDGGYWKNKYYELKKQMQEILDSDK